MTGSRTKRTIQNGRMSLFLFLIQILVGFYSRKVFLDYLGDEVIGLNTTLGNILSFLNLAELGIGIAMATSLYQPIHDNNHQEICDILSVQGWLYKKISWILCGLSIPILISIPYIFPNTECGLVYIYLAYIVFLSGSIISYISLWIGARYLLSETTLILLIVGMFIRMTRSVVDSFKNAYQLFSDIWAPIAEAAIHLGCSILFGYMWGLNGIILGGILSQIIIVLLWKPYYTFREGLKSSSIYYFIQYAMHIGILIGSALLVIRAFGHQLNQPVDWQRMFALISWIIIASLLYAVISFSLLYLLTNSMRRFTQRIYHIITHRL